VSRKTRVSAVFVAQKRTNVIITLATPPPFPKTLKAQTIPKTAAPGLMQDHELLISSLLLHAEQNHFSNEMVSHYEDGRIPRQTFVSGVAKLPMLLKGST
jgi:hypothetical protein